MPSRADTGTCIGCGKATARKTPRSALPKRCEACNKKARRERSDRWKRGYEAGEALGPDTPLNGIGPREAERIRQQRIAKAAADGVPTYALIERFGCDKRTVAKAMAEHGVVRGTDERWPYGVPA